MNCVSRATPAIRLVYVLLAVLALANSGCLLVAAGAAGGAAMGYAYYKGKICQVYNAGFTDAWAATHTALADLGMPVVKEEQNGTCGSIETRTSDGEHVRIHLENIVSKFPAEGSLTRICVRVATFGDPFVSDRVLDQVGAHLAPPGSIAPPPGAAPNWAPAQGQPETLPPARVAPPATGVQQTAPPPLLPPETAPMR